MKFVLTNDDGVDGPGLAALQAALGGQGAIVAPMGALSGCSHRVTTYEGPIHVDRRGEDVYAIDGTPADCSRIALSKLYPEAEVVLAGINPGGNLGVDIYISGTVAAVREAAFLGRVGIAVSHFIRIRQPLDWERASRWTAAVVEDLLAKPVERGEFWNVNLPHPEADEPDPEVVFCDPCTQPLPVNYRVEDDQYHYEGVYSKRLRDPGADVDLCFSGKITVSKLRI